MIIKLKNKWIIHVLFAVYMCMLFKFTIFRYGFSLQNFMRGGILNLNLFTGYVPFVRCHMWGRFLYLFVGNIAAFIPFGAYLGYRGVKALPTAVYGFLLSFFIESMQYMWGVGISELDDLILNTAGVMAGVLAVKIWRRWKSQVIWGLK